jgi:ABC-type branched-subunit amino acid transport system ATPase component
VPLTGFLELFKVFDKLRQHISIVIVEHNLDLMLALADRVSRWNAARCSIRARRNRC